METQQNQASGASVQRRLGGHFRLVSLATTFSRIAGFLRDTLNAAVFGAGAVSDAYFAALRIPSLLRDLFAEGALSASFVPTLSKSLQKESPEETWALISQVFSFLLLSTGLVVGLGMIFTPWIVPIVAPGFSTQPEKLQLTISLTRMLFPVLLFVSMAAFWMGCLNAHHRFGTAAFSPVAMNLVLILAGLALLYYPPLSESPDPLLKIHLWTGATTLGMLFQWLVQIPALRKLGKLRWAWPPAHPGFKEMLLLMGPSVISLSVTQIDFMLNQIFASFLDTGSITCLNYGNRMMQLPYGVFGVSIATVVFPLLSQQMASGDKAGYQNTLNRALEAAAFITWPSIVGLSILSFPVCRLAFEHGHFGAGPTQLVAEATVCYVLGLFAQTGIKILTQAFYPLNQPRWPLWAALANMAATALLNLSALLFIPDPHLKFLAFPLATTVGALGNFWVLCWGLQRYGLQFETQSFLKEGARIAAATLGMALVAGGLLFGLERTSLPLQSLLQVFVPALGGAAFYFYAAKLLKCSSAEWVLQRRSKKKPN